MLLTFVYKLYPTSEQEGTLCHTLEVLRHLYNNALAERIDAYQNEGRTVGYLEQQNRLPVLKQKAEPLKSIYSQVVQDCLRRLDKAYQAFFQRVQKGSQAAGFPRFKGVGRYRSLTFPKWESGVKIVGKALRLSKIGDVAVRLHRPLEGSPKTATITRKADGWYVGIVCEVAAAPLPQTGEEVGIDVGIENFATLTDDHPTIANPRPLKKAQAKLRKAQRRLERRTRRDKNHKMLVHQSKRREKAKILLAKAHQRVARARRDFHHKVAHALIRQFDTIYIENLRIGNMLRNHHLARAIADAGWGQFFEVLKQQAARAVKTVIEVCPKNTSQNCSACDQYVPKSLSCRTHTCPYCGLVLHRDKNAAHTIRKVGRDAADGRKRNAGALA